MRAVVKILFLVVSMSIVSCKEPFYGYKYETGSLPEQPVNLSEFNTEYDDYNATSPILGDLIPFCFSTNRNSYGEAFDVIFRPMSVNFDKSSGALNVTSEYGAWSSLREEYEVIMTGVSKIRTSGNELGPNLIPEYVSSETKFTLLYSTDISGNAQINFISNHTDAEFSEPQEVQFLNSSYHDMYPTINAERSRIYFCSDRGGEDFDFYYVDIDPEMNIEKLLSDTTNFEVMKDTGLSSNYNDKCPFIFDNKMVFASDRDGGFGGFDLYYSVLENGEWSEPVNFGETINTASDEYRPILLNEEVTWTQTMMVFSSNRTGGLGGFDLYFVGIAGE